MRVSVIAEIGVNHNNDLDVAERLIEDLARLDIDYVKFQLFDPVAMSTPQAPLAPYQSPLGDSVGAGQRQMLEELAISHEFAHAVKRCCVQRGLKFLATAFDDPSLDLLKRLDPEVLKISSGEITNLPFLMKHAEFGKPILLSTGMATLAEIDVAVRLLISRGISRDMITILQCNSAYPTRYEDLNLRTIPIMAATFGVEVGLSDHSIGIEAGIMAVAMGAKVIEKHVTLDTGMPGPDHKASMQMDEFGAFVRHIRNAELALGSGLKAPTASEMKNTPVVRKSIVATKRIVRGDHFSLENIGLKRPEGGLPPSFLDFLIAREAQKDYDMDDFIEL